MVRMLYCWRCKMNIPMLEDHEWEQVTSLGRSLGRFTQVARMDAVRRYNEMTGFKESSSNAIWHHRISLVGSPCRVCSKPLRTPRAKWCAACGASVASEESTHFG
jgi:hypothetical protein